MEYVLSDGTAVEYRVLTPADVTAVVTETPDDATMFVEVIRVAVMKPDNILERLAGLLDPVGQTALLGMEIMLAALRAQSRLRPPKE